VYYGQRTLSHAKVGAGRLNGQSTRIEQSVPSLVSRDLWERASAAMRGHVSNFHTTPSDGFIYLLSGKLVCAECGFRMIGNYRKANADHPTPRPLYACSRARGRFAAQRTPGEHCIGGTHDGTKLEHIVLEAIDDLIEHPQQTLDALAQQQQERHGNVAQQASQQKAIQQRLAKLEHGRAGLVEALTRGDLSADEFRTATANNASQSAEARRELSLLEADGALAQAIDAQLSEARDVIALLSEEWPLARAANDRAALRAMIGPLVQQVKVSRDKTVHYTILFERSSDSHHSCEYLRIGSPLSLASVGRAA
jgi:hypothetical protein